MGQIGLCHSCLTSNVEVINDKGQQICMDCYHKRHKQSQENKEITNPPTFEQLKKKLERR